MKNRKYIVKVEGKERYSIYRRERKVKGIGKLAKTLDNILEKEMLDSRNAQFELESRKVAYQVVLDDSGERSLFKIVDKTGEVVASVEYYRDLYVEISELTRKHDEAGCTATFDFRRAVL